MGRVSIDIQRKKDLATLTLKWCKKNLGVNKRKKLPKISVRIRFINGDKNHYGSYYFEENRIIIYDLKCKTMYDVVSTVIHEYTHYLQSMKKYFDYFTTHYYSTHPYEKQAEKNANQYSKKCLYEIKKLLN